MKQDKKLVNFRISETLAEELKEVSEAYELPQSQVVRDAVREKVAEMKRKLSAPVTEEVSAS